MDENVAWLNFVNTGSIEDYLIYNKIKEEREKSAQEDYKNADQHRGIDS